MLGRFGYAHLARARKTVVLRYLEHTTSYSRQQLTRLVRRYLDCTTLAKRYRSPAHGFARKFSSADVALLAETDVLHGTLSGPATKQIMQRAYTVYGDTRYQRLAGLSVSHLYNLRAQAGYRGQAGALDQDQGSGQLHRPAPRPSPRAAPWVHPHRQRSPRRPGRLQGRLSHQRRWTA